MNLRIFGSQDYVFLLLEMNKLGLLRHLLDKVSVVLGISLLMSVVYTYYLCTLFHKISVIVIDCLSILKVAI